MAVYVADAHAKFQTMVLVVKMASVLEECIPQSSVLLCVFVGKRTQWKGYL
jgi:hypothetical protein